jgi:hypothetical protein
MTTASAQSLSKTRLGRRIQKCFSFANVFSIH